MNLEQVKVKLLGSADKQFGFSNSTDAKGNVDPNWMRMWDNDKRESINIPTEVYNKIKANPNCSNLHISTLQKVSDNGNGKPYLHHTIAMHTEAQYTL